MKDNNNNYLNSLKLDMSLMGEVELDERWQKNNVCDPFSRIYFVKEGSGYLRTDDTEIIMKPGYMYFIPCETKFNYGCTKLEKIFFHINVTDIENDCDIFSVAKHIIEIPLTLELYYKLAKSLFIDEYADMILIKKFVYDCINELCSLYNIKRKTNTYSAIIKKAISIINENPVINLRTKDIAKNLFIAESTLRKTFKEETGVPLHAYIENAVMTKAKLLLMQNVYSIKEISLMLGFCDRFYFSRRFSAMFKETPASYRYKSSYELVEDWLKKIKGKETKKPTESTRKYRKKDLSFKKDH